MRAVSYRRFGPAAEVLEVGTLPDPSPGPGEVLVRVHASGVNPSDVKSRAGRRGSNPDPLIVPHNDGAGVIEAVGSGVDQARVGERVWLWNTNRSPDGSTQGKIGTAAELVALPAAQAGPLVGEATFVEGACLGVPAMTAHRAVFADGPVRGKTVLVTGGAGAVGFYAIQFAKWGGARVLATVSSVEKSNHALAAGADATIDYKREDVAARVGELTGGAGVDHIVEVDFGANIETSTKILRPGGCIAPYASMAAPNPAIDFYGLMGKNAAVRFVLVYSMDDAAKAAAVRDITAMLRQNQLKHLVAATFALDEIVAAHEAVESGRMVGNVVVIPIG